MKQSIGLRKRRPRRHGLKLAGGYRCKCCFVPEEAKAKERELCRAEIEAQLSDFPPEEMRAMARLEAWEDANPNWREELLNEAE